MWNVVYTFVAQWCGKSSLLRALLAMHPADQMRLSISHTTRAIRPAETEGVDYHFVSQAQFKQLIAANAFYEWAEVFGAYYGTHRANIEQSLAMGLMSCWILIGKGARQIRQQAEHVVSIFILPPSLQALKERLDLHARNKTEVITARMQQAQYEISHYDEFDYLIVNDNFEQPCMSCTQLYKRNGS